MSDCTSGELRDLLPELMHGRLDADVQRAVEGHVAACPTCAEELALLRSLRATLTPGPRVNVQRIAATVHARTTGAPQPETLRHRGPWRIAIAAAALLAASGIGYAIVMRGHARAPESMIAAHPIVAHGPDSASVPRVATPSHVTPPHVTPPHVTPAPVTPPQQIAAATPLAPTPHATPTTAAAGAEVIGNLSDLSDNDLRALSASLDGLSSVPDAEPSPVIDPLGASLDDLSGSGS